VMPVQPIQLVEDHRERDFARPDPSRTAHS
jgi:hypothetical protein